MLHLSLGATLRLMPTQKPRHTITETGDVAKLMTRVRRLYPSTVSDSTIVKECFLRGAALKAAEGDESAVPNVSPDIVNHLGSWVGLSAAGLVLIADPDPRRLGARIRTSGVVVSQILRVPDRPEQTEGSHGSA